MAVNLSATRLTNTKNSNRAPALFLAGSLSLGPNNFTGSIPRAVFGLSHLRYVYLDNCNLEGQISSEIGNLSNLQALGLHGNFLNGGIPDSIGNLLELGKL